LDSIGKRTGEAGSDDLDCSSKYENPSQDSRENAKETVDCFSTGLFKWYFCVSSISCSARSNSTIFLNLSTTGDWQFILKLIPLLVIPEALSICTTAFKGRLDDVNGSVDWISFPSPMIFLESLVDTVSNYLCDLSSMNQGVKNS
jgi:hypothetical protein